MSDTIMPALGVKIGVATGGIMGALVVVVELLSLQVASQVPPAVGDVLLAAGFGGMAGMLASALTLGVYKQRVDTLREDVRDIKKDVRMLVARSMHGRPKSEEDDE